MKKKFLDKTKTKKIKEASIKFIVSSLIFVLSFSSYFVSLSSAATYNFTQSNWTGGATTTNAVHPANQTGWTNFSSASNAMVTSVPSQLTIASTSASTTQTTDTDFNTGVATNTLVSGTGSAARVVLTKDLHTNEYTVGHLANVSVTVSAVAQTGPWLLTLSGTPNLSRIFKNDKFTDSAGKAWKVLSLNPSTTTPRLLVIDSEGNNTTPAGGIGTVGRWYGDLAAWNTGRAGNLVTRNAIERALPYYDVAADTSQLVITGWTTDANHYVEIFVPFSERHRGKWDSGRYNMNITLGTGPYDTYGVNVDVPNVKIDGLQLKVSRSGYSAHGIATFGTNVSISNSIIVGNITGAVDTSITSYGGIAVSDTVGNVTYLSNNIIYGFANSTSTNLSGVSFGAGTIYAYNNTIYGSYNGFREIRAGIDVAHILKNNIANGNTNDYLSFNGTFACGTGCFNNISGDGTAPGTNSKATTTVVFKDAVNKDFHLEFNDTAAKNAGVDLSADAGLPITTDIDNNTRTAPWDIGASDVGPVYVHTNSIGTAARDFATMQAWNDGRKGVLTTRNVFKTAGQTGAFTARETIIGSVSGATGKYIPERATPAASEPYMSLDILTGAFQAGETLTGSSSAKTAVLSSIITASGTIERGEAYNDSVFTSGVSISGSTANASHYVWLSVEPRSRHWGVAGTGATINPGDYQGGISFSVPYTVVEWLTLDGNNNTLLYGAIGAGSGGQWATVKNNIIKDWVNSGQVGLYVYDYGNVINNIIYNFTGASEAIRLSYGSSNAYNNTIYNAKNAFFAMYGTNQLSRNNIVASSTAAYSVISPGTWSASSSNNVLAGVGGTAPGSNNLNYQSLGGVKFVSTDPNLIDLHLMPESVARGAGADLSAAFKTDIDNQIRSAGAWDAGADQWKVSSPIYKTSGSFTSGTIDFGTKVNLQSLTWNQANPLADTKIGVQVAANNDNATWNYVTYDGFNYPTGVAVDEKIVRQDCTGYTNCYNTLSAALAAYTNKDLVAQNKVASIKIDGAWTTSDDVATTFYVSGWTTSPTNFVRIWTTPAARAQGVWDSTKYRLRGISATPLNLGIGNIIVDGLQIEASSTYGVNVLSSVVDGALVISNNIIKGTNAAQSLGIDLQGGKSAKIFNNIIYNFAYSGIRLENGRNTTSYVYNNTVKDISVYWGINTYSPARGSYVVSNNIVQNAVGGDYRDAYGTFSSLSDYNISSDTSAPGVHSKKSTTATFIDGANYDLRLAAADTAAKDSGMNLGADANAPFGTDIAGNSRSGTWDIGAYEYGASPFSQLFGGQRYVKYRANLSTSDFSKTPLFDDVALNYATFATSTALISSPFNTNSYSNVIAKLAWAATGTSTTSIIKFQLRTAPDSTTTPGTPGTWSAWLGPDGTTNTYFTANDGSQTMPAIFATSTGNQWLQYQAFMLSDGTASPTLSSTTITYVVNAPPQFDPTYGANGAVAYQSSTTGATLGKVLITYRVKDIDSDTDTGSINSIKPSFEYSTNTGATWTAISSSTLGASDLNNLAVSTSTYATGTATWNAGAQLGNAYYANMMIRVIADDVQGANNIGRATTTAFVLDVKSPANGGATIDAGIAGQTNGATITVNMPSDDNSVSYLVSDTATTSPSSTGWVSLTATTTINWTFNTALTSKSVYLQYKDAFGNLTATATITAPQAVDPATYFIQDVSSVSVGDYKEYLGWATTTAANFSAYRIEYSTSTDNSAYGAYAVAANVADPAANYFVHSGLNTSWFYKYRITVVDTLGNKSFKTGPIVTKPDGVQNYGEGGGGSVATPSLVNNIIATQGADYNVVVNYKLTDNTNTSKTNPSYEGYIFYDIGISVSSSTAGTITLTDSSKMPASGFIEIGSEVIGYATNTTSTNTLSGLTRGVWPTTGTTRTTRQNATISAGSVVWVKATSTSPYSIPAVSITTGQTGTINWNTASEANLAGNTYSNFRVRALVHDNQATSSSPLSSENAQSSDGIITSFNMLAPTIGFATSTGSGLETIGTSTFTVSLSRPYALPVSVGYAVSASSTAVSGVDYILPSSTIVTFAAGATSTAVNFNVIHDNLSGGNKNLIINLINPVNGSVNAGTAFTYTIIETDNLPTIQFKNATSSGRIDVWMDYIPLVLSQISSGNTDVSVSYTVDASSTAVAGVDYTLPSSTTIIPAGTTTANIALNVILLNTYGPNKTLILNLSSSTNAVLGTTTKFTYTIINTNNVAPAFRLPPTASQDASSTKVIISYLIRDANTNLGTVTPGYVTPSFEYNTGLGWNPISSSSLATGDLDNKAVSTSTFTTYTATWNAKAQIGGISNSTTQVRVTLNDNEPTNNIATSISPAFAIDYQAPQISQFNIDQTSSTLKFNLADQNNLSYIVSNNADLTPDAQNASSSGQWITATTTASVSMPWVVATATTSTSTASTTPIYLGVKDIFGNMATTSITAPNKLLSFAFHDISDVPNKIFKELISWLPYVNTTSSQFASYIIYRSTNGGTTYEPLTTITNIATNYYTDTGLSSSTTYYYKGVVVDTNGSISPYSDVVADLPDGIGATDQTLPIISNVLVAQAQSTWAQITWTTNKIANSTIDYSTDSSYNNSTSVATYVTNHSVVINGLNQNTQYFFRVKSTDVLGNAATPITKEASSTVLLSFTTTGGPIINQVVSSAVTEKSAIITWHTNKDSDSTVVYSTNSGFNGQSSAVGLTTTLASGTDYLHTVNLTNLNSGTTYYYYVKSTDGANNQTIENKAGAYYTFATANDIFPVVISNISTPVIAPNSAVIFWQTDKLASSQISYGLTASSSDNITNFDPVGTIYHSVAISSLPANTKIYFTVKSKGMNGLETIATTTSFMTTKDGEVKIIAVGGSSAPSEIKDTTPPIISNVEVSAITAFGAVVSFDTNKPTVGFVQYGKDEKYGDVSADKTLASHHDIKLSRLQFGTDYHYQIQAVDKNYNSTNSEDKKFTTKFFAESLSQLKTVENVQQFQQEVENSIETILPSLLPPYIEKPQATDVTENSATIIWRTNTKTYSTVSYADEGEYNKDPKKPYNAEAADTSNKVLDHKITLIGLKSNTKYHFQVKSYSLPQVVGSSTDMTFITQAAKVQARVVDVKNTSFRVSWTTDFPASTIVNYKNIKTGITNRKIDDAKKTFHDMLVENLEPGTSYEVKVMGYNENGNLVEGGEPQTITTSRDVAPPKISGFKIDSALVPGKTNKLQTVISWITDEPANSQIFYQEGAAQTNKEFSNKVEYLNTYTTNHTIIVTNMKPGTLYQIKIVSSDQAGNKAIFGPRTIITPRQSESIMDVIFKNFEDTFKFMRNVGQ